MGAAGLKFWVNYRSYNKSDLKLSDPYGFVRTPAPIVNGLPFIQYE